MHFYNGSWKPEYSILIMGRTTQKMNKKYQMISTINELDICKIFHNQAVEYPFFCKSI
jgi:hypothetical protein